MYRRVLGALAGVLPLLLGLSAPASGAAGVGHPTVVSDDPSNRTPHVQDGKVLAIALVGGKVYVGGSFTRVRNPDNAADIARSHLFAYDPATGAVDSTFSPALNGPVQTIAPSPDGVNVVVGGSFTTVNGTAASRLVKLTPTGGRVTRFKAATSGVVYKIVVRGNRLLAAGRFAKANGAPRANLAGFDATTGALDGLALPVTESRAASGAPPFVFEMEADARGTRLVVLGNFRKVAAESRTQIAMIDLTTDTVAPWATNRYTEPCGPKNDTYMRDVDFAPDDSYFVVVTTGGASDKDLCDAAARFETLGGPKSVETWRNCTGGDTLLSVATTGAAVYVGGHQRWMDNCGGRDYPTATAVERPGLAALDPLTGEALAWNPGRTRGYGAEELVAVANGLFLGSDTVRLGGEYHARLGFFPLA